MLAQRNGNPPHRVTRGTAAGLSVFGREPHVVERSIEAERASGTRVDLTVDQATGSRIDRIGRAVGDPIRIYVGDVLASNRYGQAAPYVVGNVNVCRELGPEELPWIVVVVAERAVVVLVQYKAKRAPLVVESPVD